MHRNTLFQYGFLVSLMISPSLGAATLYELNDLQTIAAHISQEGLTRIAVRGDRIMNVFGVEGEYTLEVDEGEGQVFLKPNVILNATTKPIHISLITESGVTQDLRLIPKEMQPDAIIFLDREGQSQSLNSSQEGAYLGKRFSIITREDVVSLINACREGFIPIGYTISPVDLKDKERPYPIVKRLQGDKIQAIIYEVINRASKDISLNEASFGDDPKVIAVSLQHKVLKSGEKGEVYVVRSF